MADLDVLPIKACSHYQELTPSSAERQMPRIGSGNGSRPDRLLPLNLEQAERCRQQGAAGVSSADTFPFPGVHGKLASLCRQDAGGTLGSSLAIQACILTIL
jgi:hypothetical protein